MKKIFLVLAIIFNCLYGHTQNSKLKKFSITKTNIDYIGIKNDKGEVVIPADYVSVIIDDDYVLANDAKNVSYFNSEGKLLAKYCEINKFQYGVYHIMYCDDKTSKRYHGLMNKEGKIVLTPNKYTKIGAFSIAGLAQTEILVSNNDYNYGLIDTLGKTIIMCKYQDIDDYVGDGLIRFQQNDKWGYLNLKGEEVIKPQFDNAYPFENGKAKVSVRSPQFKQMTIDITGKVINIE